MPRAASGSGSKPPRARKPYQRTIVKNNDDKEIEDRPLSKEEEQEVLIYLWADHTGRKDMAELIKWVENNRANFVKRILCLKNNIPVMADQWCCFIEKCNSTFDLHRRSDFARHLISLGLENHGSVFNHGPIYRCKRRDPDTGQLCGREGTTQRDAMVRHIKAEHFKVGLKCPDPNCPIVFKDPGSRSHHLEAEHPALHQPNKSRKKDKSNGSGNGEPSNTDTANTVVSTPSPAPSAAPPQPRRRNKRKVDDTDAPVASGSRSTVKRRKVKAPAPVLDKVDDRLWQLQTPASGLSPVAGPSQLYTAPSFVGPHSSDAALYTGIHPSISVPLSSAVEIGYHPHTGHLPALPSLDTLQAGPSMVFEPFSYSGDVFMGTGMNATWAYDTLAVPPLHEGMAMDLIGDGLPMAYDSMTAPGTSGLDSNGILYIAPAPTSSLVAHNGPLTSATQTSMELQDPTRLLLIEPTRGQDRYLDDMTGTGIPLYADGNDFGYGLFDDGFAPLDASVLDILAQDTLSLSTMGQLPF